MILAPSNAPLETVLDTLKERGYGPTERLAGVPPTWGATKTLEDGRSKISAILCPSAGTVILHIADTSRDADHPHKERERLWLGTAEIRMDDPDELERAESRLLSTWRDLQAIRKGNVLTMRPTGEYVLKPATTITVKIGPASVKLTHVANVGVDVNLLSDKTSRPIQSIYADFRELETAPWATGVYQHTYVCKFGSIRDLKADDTVQNALSERAILEARNAMNVRWGPLVQNDNWTGEIKGITIEASEIIVAVELHKE